MMSVGLRGEKLPGLTKIGEQEWPETALEPDWSKAGGQYGGTILPQGAFVWDHAGLVINRYPEPCTLHSKPSEP